MKPSEIERLLPEVMRPGAAEGAPLAALLQVMAALQAPNEELLATLDRVFDPARTDDAFVPLLARWVDMDRLTASTAGGEPLSSGLGRLRELVRRAAWLSQWRGTRQGLTDFLATAVGLPGFDVQEDVRDESGRPRPFHIRVVAPADALAHRTLIERIIALEKPAYLTCELVFAPAEAAA
jgi:phage tail-like protein